MFSVGMRIGLMQRRSNLIWIVIIVIPLLSVMAALLIWAATSQSGDSKLPPATPTRVARGLTGQIAPNFELARLNSEGTLRLSSLRGRVVFINFWATWCEPCRRELPALQAFTESQQGRNAPIILAVNIGETPAQISTFLIELGVEHLNVLLDHDFSVSDRYKAVLYPTTFVINPAGVIADFHLGEITLADLNRYVAEYDR